MGLYRVRQRHRNTSSRVEACHRHTATEGFVIEVCTRACPVSMHNTDACRRLTLNTHSDTHIHFCENPISASSHLPIIGPSHLPKTHTTPNIPPHTHMHTVLSSLDVSVHDSLAANPSVGWMSVSSPFIIRLIRHPRHCFYISQQSH